MRIWLLVALAVAGIVIGGVVIAALMMNDNTRMAVVADDQVTFRLPNGQEFVMDIVGITPAELHQTFPQQTPTPAEQAQNVPIPFQLQISNKSNSSLRISVEDVLYYDRTDVTQPYELIAIDDPATADRLKAEGRKADGKYLIALDKKQAHNIPAPGMDIAPLGCGCPHKKIEIASRYSVIDVHNLRRSH